MSSALREERVKIQPLIRSSVKTWLDKESRKQERSTSWLVDRLLAEAMESAKQQEARQ